MIVVLRLPETYDPLLLLVLLRLLLLPSIVLLRYDRDMSIEIIMNFLSEIIMKYT